MGQFLRYNAGKLVGWVGLFGAAACFFGTTGVGVVFILLFLVQVFF